MKNLAHYHIRKNLCQHFERMSGHTYFLMFVKLLSKPTNNFQVILLVDQLDNRIYLQADINIPVRKQLS